MTVLRVSWVYLLLFYYEVSTRGEASEPKTPLQQESPVVSVRADPVSQFNFTANRDVACPG